MNIYTQLNNFTESEKKSALNFLGEKIMTFDSFTNKVINSYSISAIINGRFFNILYNTNQFQYAQNNRH